MVLLRGSRGNSNRPEKRGGIPQAVACEICQASEVNMVRGPNQWLVSCHHVDKLRRHGGLGMSALKVLLEGLGIRHLSLNMRKKEN